jgi:S-DNA-T family DNA segregation ATPase FtsK/SpoIIIE
MLDRSRLARSAPALFLALTAVFLGLSLGGYDPADAPGRAAEPPNNPAANPCGPVGATLSHVLFTTAGWASYLVLLALSAGVVLRIGRRPVPEKGLRLLGLGLLIVVAAALAHKYAPPLRQTPPVGNGGYVGALIALFLESQFGVAGMFLILAAAGLSGLLLCYDVLTLWPAQELWRAAEVLVRKMRSAPVGAPAALPGEPLALPAARYSVAGPDTVLPPPPLNRPVPSQPPLAAIGARALAQPAHTPAVHAPYVPALAGGDYQAPPPELLDPAPPFAVLEHEAKINTRAMLLERTLLDFGYQVRVVQIDTGPVITQFEIELEAGLSVKKIHGLADDLAIALAVPSVRIVAPIPGKSTVGIEVPNEHRQMVRLGEILGAAESYGQKLNIPLFLGKDVKGTPLAFDLSTMPHLLIAGRTGTGKSVCLNAMILSILMTKRPDEVKLILIDPKKVELSQFKRVPHLMHPVITDEKKAESLLTWACEKMDERYGYLARAEVRNIEAYNRLGPEAIYAKLHPEDEEERKRIPTYMPSIVIVIDEMSDLILQVGKEVETHIVRLAQKARAAGIHLILATQKPTVDVITGLIKSNLPARIAFQVSSRNDSRVVLDEMGAEKLLGNGDMLFLYPGTSLLVRAQGTYVSDAEVHRVCDYLQRYPIEFSRELVQLQVGGAGSGKDRGEALKQRDELYEPAIEIVIREGRGSCSLLQRALGIGYGRAARLIDFMAEDGIVGEFKSGSAREVLYTWEDWEGLKNGADGVAPAA